jgi:hypothetical protein
MYKIYEFKINYVFYVYISVWGPPYKCIYYLYNMTFGGSRSVVLTLSRYAASMAAPYPLGFIHFDLDG